MMARTTTRTRLATALFTLAATTGTAWSGPIGSSFTLSPSELGRPVLLDENGTQIRVLKGAHGATKSLPAGASPTYVAYRLDKASELPSGFPTINVGPGTAHSGPARGPLRLDTLAKTALDAELAKSGEAAVHLPRQTYVVESLSSLLGSTSGDAATQIWMASTATGGAKPRPAASDGSSLGDTLKGWFTSSTNAVQNLNTQIADAIKRQLFLDPPKPVIIPPKTTTKTAAQLLAPPTADGSIQPAPVPEPASLLVFAAAIGAVALRVRAGRTRNR
ncbi:MAG: hypothetical protein P4L85_07365 [Paludisphaera borealis]|uniref:hypothetical protein n=1 Tax=Paludisphaera borealis TaxID=1387353 RepID=UPI002845F064|nr:hypothetical protein [Paludisphaera borealis]MDR3619152.1 hypothetical protein [Paludisphaera borealis]